MRSLRRTTTSLLTVAALGANAGCYSYRVVQPRDAIIGDGLRARISGAQAERLEPVLGSTDREVEGELLEQQDSAIVLAVRVTLGSQGGGVGIAQAHQRILLPLGDVQELERRSLDRTRTTLAVGAGIAAAATILAASTGAIRLGNGGSRPNPNTLRTPVPITFFRVPLSR